MQRVIAQEFHIYDEEMLASRLFYMSAAVKEVWQSKKKAYEEKQIYFGG